MGEAGDDVAVDGGGGRRCGGGAGHYGRIHGAVEAGLSSGEAGEWGREELDRGRRWEDVWAVRQGAGDDHACRIHATLHRREG